MRRGLFILFFVFFLFLFAKDTDASLVTVKKDGGVVIKVLSSEDSIALGVPEGSNLEVKQVANEGVEQNTQINLEKKDGKVSLKVGNDADLDVTDWGDDLVEIEEKPETKKVKIKLENNNFLIFQQGVSAITDHPINIDTYDNKLALSTATGKKYLKVLPFDAAQSILRTRILSQVEKSPFELVEEESGFNYIVKGNKVISVFDLYDFKIPITAKVSASTGEVISIDEPDWLKPLSFLFV